MLRARNTSQCQHDNTQTSDIILDNEGEIIFQVDFNLAAKVGTLDKVGEIFKREFALNNFTDVLFFDEFHIAVGFGPTDFSLGEAAGTFKDKFHAVLGGDRFDFNFVGDTGEIADDFLEVGGG